MFLSGYVMPRCGLPTFCPCVSVLTLLTLLTRGQLDNTVIPVTGIFLWQVCGALVIGLVTHRVTGWRRAAQSQLRVVSQGLRLVWRLFCAVLWTVNVHQSQETRAQF